MQLLPVEYLFEVEDDDFNIVAKLDGCRIGNAWGTRDDDRLTLEDIGVIEDDQLSLALRQRFGSLRRRGIGTEILRRFLERADAEGITEIRGDVMPDAIVKNRGLLSWYERHGFIVSDAAGEGLKGAKKMIVRYRPR